MFFADRYYGYDDALYAACRLIEIVANSAASRCRRKPRDAAAHGLATPEIRVDCPDEIKFDVVARTSPKAYFRGKRQSKWSTLTACAMLFPNGWGSGACLQHATGAGDAFRSYRRKAPRRLPQRTGSRRGRSPGGHVSVTQPTSGPQT
jgi:hypothetical protein